MPATRPSAIPEPLPLRAKPLTQSGTWARKSRLEALEASRLDEERRLAAAFAEALDDRGISNGKVAEWLGLSSATVVRDMRTRKCRITGVHLAKLPPDLCKAILLGFRRHFAPDDLRALTANDNDHTG
jgi:hypothetical protein